MLSYTVGVGTGGPCCLLLKHLVSNPWAPIPGLLSQCPHESWKEGNSILDTLSLHSVSRGSSLLLPQGLEV